MKSFKEFGIDISTDEAMNFYYGKNVFGPNPEFRYLKDIRKSLEDYNSDGPDKVYSIVMGVGNSSDRLEISNRNLLFGVVTYAKGRVGREPIRSQGHIHAISKCGESTPEVYEIWSGEAYIYMQQYADDDPGICCSVHAKVGDVVIVPPGWVHATISANENEELTFGAWCVQDYAFEYDKVREHNGVAWFPIYNKNKIEWVANPNYNKSLITVKEAREYPELGIDSKRSIYSQFVENPNKFNFVSNPGVFKRDWEEIV